MDTNMVFTCGEDSFYIADILYAEIAFVTTEELLIFEQVENGTYVPAEDIYSPSFRDEFNRVVNKYNLAHHSKPVLKPEDAPEKYRWDSPSHWEMMSGDRFCLLDFDESGDANVRWTFCFRSPERFGNFTATSSRIIKLKYLIARLEGILNSSVTQSKFKRGWIEFWTSTKYSDIQKDILPILEEYNSAIAKIQEREKHKVTFFSQHKYDIVLHIFLKDGSKKIYLENQCGFDIFDKETEIHSKIAEYEKIQEKINNSNNRGEQIVEYHIKWILKSLNKYVVTINGDCESKYRYNCIMLRNDDFLDEAQEYDHILVTPAGVILIETKDWKGTTSIAPDGKWTRINEENGTVFGVRSPLMQIRRHEQLLASIVPSVPVYSILCFSNSSAIINGKENVNYPVINIEQLEDTLSDICLESIYNEHDVDMIASTIEKYKVNKP